jgi:hypothetical protein
LGQLLDGLKKQPHALVDALRAGAEVVREMVRNKQDSHRTINTNGSCHSYKREELHQEDSTAIYSEFTLIHLFSFSGETVSEWLPNR